VLQKDYTDGFIIQWIYWLQGLLCFKRFITVTTIGVTENYQVIIAKWKSRPRKRTGEPGHSPKDIRDSHHLPFEKNIQVS
jgi:hypothetical protein